MQAYKVTSVDQHDVADLILLARVAITEATWSEDLGVDEEVLLSTMLKHIHDESGGMVRVLKHNGKIVGVFGALLHPYFKRMAFEILWYVDPQHRKHGLTFTPLLFLKEYERWAKGKGMKYMLLGTLEYQKPEKAVLAKLNKYFKKLGYEEYEHSLIRRL